MSYKQSNTALATRNTRIVAALAAVALAANSASAHAAFPQFFGKGLEAFEAGFAKVHLAQICLEAISFMPAPPDAERVSKVTAMRTLFWRVGDVTFEIRCFGGYVLNTTRTAGAPSFFSTK